MSTTLTWRHAGPGTKTGTTNAALFDDIQTLVNTKSGDANYKWQVASKDTASNPLTLVLKRKDGSAGRILFAIYTGVPGANNPAAIASAPSLNGMYIGWFPAGTTDSPSNLTSASGTVMGDDTNSVKFVQHAPVSSLYSASIQPFYFECDDAFVLGLNNPANTTTYINGAGKLFVDSADVAYDGIFRGSAVNMAPWGVQSSSVMVWASALTVVNPGSSSSCYIVNYGTNNSIFYHAYVPSGPWTGTAVGSNDILTDTANAKAWFVPMLLLGTTKGQGFAIKLRQIALGPVTSAAFTAYNESGPVVAARQFCATTAGSSTSAALPWFTNFKI